MNEKVILAILNDRSTPLRDTLEHLDQETCVRFAVWCARRVVHLDPTGKALPAIEAAEAWLLDPSERNCARADKAGNAAYADAAARAANAAGWAAAWSATYATRAAAYYAASATNAADAAARAAKALPAHAQQAEQEAQRYQLKLMVYNLLPEEENKLSAILDKVDAINSNLVNLSMSLDNINNLLEDEERE